MKKTTLTALAVGAIALGAITVGSAVSAYQGDYKQEGPNHTEEREAVITQAFENNDYHAWKENMQDRGRVTEVITEENFARFAEAHRLGKAGDIAGADAIRAELGLRTSNSEALGLGRGKGQKQGSGQGSNKGKGLRDGSKGNANCMLNQ